MIISGYGTVPIVAAMPVVMGRKKTFLAFYALDANAQFNYDRYFTEQPSGPNPQSEFSVGYFQLAAGIAPKPQTVAIVGADAEFGQIAMAGAREHAKKHGSRSSMTRAIRWLPDSPRSRQHEDPQSGSRRRLYPPDTAGMLRAIYEVGLTAEMIGGGMVGCNSPRSSSSSAISSTTSSAYDYYAPEPR